MNVRNVGTEPEEFETGTHTPLPTEHTKHKNAIFACFKLKTDQTEISLFSWQFKVVRNGSKRFEMVGDQQTVSNRL